MANYNKVFLSYAREDHRLAERIYLDLRRAEINVWMDTKCLLPGQDWKREVKKSIKESAYFIALISSKSINKRGYVQSEMKEALNVATEIPAGQIFIIPVRLENVTPIDDELLHLNWVDLYQSYNKGIGRILSVLANLQKEQLQFLDPVVPVGYRAPIDYEPFVNYAEFVREIMSRYPDAGHFIDKKHALYITYETTTHETSIPEHLIAQYPDKMTIVLQHQFRNLMVNDKWMVIDLWFNQVKETLRISYDSIVELASTIGFRVTREV